MTLYFPETSYEIWQWLWHLSCGWSGLQSDVVQIFFCPISLLLHMSFVWTSIKSAKYFIFLNDSIYFPNRWEDTWDCDIFILKYSISSLQKKKYIYNIIFILAAKSKLFIMFINLGNLLEKN